MYMVYWTEQENGMPQARSRLFESNDMLGAMRWMEELRGRQRGGERISFVVMSSENPDAVGPAGVDETGPDYNWKKRRR
jgi:hypothetical protein